jgi:hypothetical protein
VQATGFGRTCTSGTVATVSRAGIAEVVADRIGHEKTGRLMISLQTMSEPAQAHCCLIDEQVQNATVAPPEKRRYTPELDLPT